MTREEVMILDMEGCEERAAKIAEETCEASEEILAELSAELDMIEERKEIIKAEAEEKRAAMEAVLEGEGEVIEESKEERKLMDNKELRSSAEYLNAWVEYQKGRASEEQRALLTTNADLGSDVTGTIAVPTAVEERIHTAWEKNEIMRRIKKSYFKGNLKVGYEAFAESAYMHAEGSEAIDEEELVIGFVNLVPVTVKKMVRYSTEVMDLKGQAWVDYIFDEIEYQIVKTIVLEAMYQASNSALAETYTAAGASLTTADIVQAQGELGGEAENPVLIIDRSGAAALKAAALSAQYGYDPFDGLELVIVDTNDLHGNMAFVADLSGIQANFPNGDEVNFIFDEYTEAPADIVRVIGRMMVAVDLVAPGKFVKIIEA